MIKAGSNSAIVFYFWVERFRYTEVHGVSADNAFRCVFRNEVNFKNYNLCY